ncbi:response regulator transcription factor [Streptomyces sp. 142MFCol3.1]|uniref:response regulator transcription factor n=1 Tax=Streptomyces sp. 142MFCol3.1 TaxID=1172179 RepID=UPI0005627531|nr:response regulator transcription factor [Streptomyces sp. 142MFCol3.1]
MEAQNVVTVTIRAHDPISKEGTAVYLRSQPRIRVLSPGAASNADVVLVLAGQVTEATMVLMREAAVNSTNDGMRMVLVAASLTESQLVRAVGYGLASVLLRSCAGMARIAAAVLGTRSGRAELPAELTRVLLEELRAMQSRMPECGRLQPFDARETEVLRMLAKGLDTAEIATALNYSERTVKNVIHGIISRAGVRNRTHAVAYALTYGLI